MAVNLKVALHPSNNPSIHASTMLHLNVYWYLSIHEKLIVGPPKGTKIYGCLCILYTGT